MERPKRSSRARRFAAAGVLLAGGLLLLRLLAPVEPAGGTARPEVARAPAASEVTPAVSAVEREAEPVPLEVEGRRQVESEAAVQPPLADPTQADAGATVRGRVFDVGGGPVGGVRVVAEKTKVEGKPPSAIADADGRFELFVAEAYDSLHVDDLRFVNLRVPEVRRTSRNVEHPIVVARAIRVAGRVIDVSHEPVSGVRIELILERRVYDGVSAPLDTTRQIHSWRTNTGEGGAFLYKALPAVPDGTLRFVKSQSAWSEGRDGALRIVSNVASTERLAPLVPTDSLEVVLQLRVGSEFQEDDDYIRGTVASIDQGPALGAEVRAGRNKAVTDERGAFRMSAKGIGPDDSLVVTLTGYAAFVDADFGTNVQSGHRRFDGITLRNKAAAIAGQLVDTNGEACVGWSLKLLSGTEVDPNVFPPVFAEDLAAGGKIMVILRTRRGPERQPGASRLTGETPNQQKTGEDGSFRIEGLMPFGYYVLRAWNPNTLQIVESDPIRAGDEDYLFRVPTDVFRDRVWGTVRGLDGTPIENVRVRLTMRVHQNRSGTSFHTGQELHTGPDGAFEFADVPRVDLLLRFTGEEVASLYRDFPAYEAGTNLDVRLARRCYFRYETTPGPNAPDALRILDRFGEGLRMKVAEAGRSSSPERVTLEHGRTGVLGADENARWLVLVKDGKELRRLPLRLTPGEVVLIQE